MELDLRKNRRVKSAEAAYLDLNRSFFSQRLRVLKIGFQKLVPGSKSQAVWTETRVLQWTPEAEIEMVEAELMGETFEMAVAYAFKKRLDSSVKIADAAKLIRQACECVLPQAMEYARGVLQKLAVDTGAVEEAT